MSNDYAALITTLIVAVLAVGTIQTYTFMKRSADLQAEVGEQYVEAQQHIIDLLNQGRVPSTEEMEAATMRWWTPWRLASKWLAAQAAGALWIAVCGFLVFIQAQVLRWAAMEEPKPKASELAETSFLAVIMAVSLLVAEGVLRSFAEVQRRGSDARRRLRQQNSAADRDRLRRAIEVFKKTGQLPAVPASPVQTPPTPPASP
ncbi:hypothetical protein ABZY19_39015 [Streptomyces sp. NPDC006475]|uniref:hypothetical protein n=1 Tax=Streptomyces sp. NPDC006475 TaxID=3155719 RepID=UPI0033BE8679